MYDKPSFQALPVEIRFMVYKNLVQDLGAINVFANHKIEKEMDKTVAALTKVNNRIKAEVEDCFYKNQTFQFRSIKGMDAFMYKIRRHHASLIKSIEIGPHLSRQTQFTREMVKWLACLPSLERLTILDANGPLWTILRPKDGGYPYRTASHSTCRLLCASKRLASGKLYADFASLNVWFLPQGAKVPEARKDWEKWAPHRRPGDPAVVELEIPERCIATHLESEFHKSAEPGVSGGNDTERCSEDVNGACGMQH